MRSIATPRRSVKPAVFRWTEPLSPQTGIGWVIIRGADGEWIDYTVQELSVDPRSGATRLWSLFNVIGEQLYHVHEDQWGLHCDCPDHTFRHEHKTPTGCKHCQAIRGHLQGQLDTAGGVWTPFPAACADDRWTLAIDGPESAA